MNPASTLPAKNEGEIRPRTVYIFAAMLGTFFCVGLFFTAESTLRQSRHAIADMNTAVAEMKEVTAGLRRYQRPKISANKPTTMAPSEAASKPPAPAPTPGSSNITESLQSVMNWINPRAAAEQQPQ